MNIKKFCPSYTKCCAVFELYDDYAKYYELEKGEHILYTGNQFIVIETAEQNYDFLINKFFAFGPYCKILSPFRLRNYYLKYLKQTISAQDIKTPK